MVPTAGTVLVVMRWAPLVVEDPNEPSGHALAQCPLALHRKQKPVKVRDGAL